MALWSRYNDKKQANGQLRDTVTIEQANNFLIDGVDTNQNELFISATHPIRGALEIPAVDEDITTGAYYVQDLVAFAKAAGKTDAQISAALNDAKIDCPYANAEDKTWTADRVTEYNSNFNKSTEYIQQYLDDHYVGWNARVSVHGSSSGQYRYYISYINPITGDSEVKDISNGAGIKDGSLESKEQAGTFINQASGSSLPVAYSDTTTAEQSQKAKDNYETLAGEAGKLYNQLNEPGVEAAVSAAPTNRTITDAEYEELKIKFPNLSDAQIYSTVEQNPWVLDTLKTNLNKTELDKELPSLSDFKQNAEAINKINSDINNINITSARQNALDNIVRDNTLAKALNDLRNQGSAVGLTAGAQAAATQEPITEAKTNYLAQSDELLKAIADLPASERDDIYKRLDEEQRAHAEQQLQKAFTQESLRASDIANLRTAADLIRTGIANEIEANKRKINEEATRVQNKGSTISTNAQNTMEVAAQESNSALQNVLNEIDRNAKLESYIPLMDLDQYFKNNPMNADIALDLIRSTGASTTPAKLVDYNEGLIDETFVKKLKDSGILDSLFNKDTYKYATETKTADAFAKAFDLEHYLNKEALQDEYKSYADAANQASDRTFNQAQRAYLASIAAGDIKTMNALTSLAKATGVAKQNVYNTSALTTSLNNQQNNARVGNTMQTNYLNQIKNNAAKLAEAKDAATKQFSRVVAGDANNPNFPSLSSLQVQSAANSAEGANVYAGMYSGVGEGQSAFNSAVSAGNQAVNDIRTSLANSLNNTNTSGIINNIANKNTLNNTKTQLKDLEHRLKNIADGIEVP